jgi:hypothetical protein
MKLARQMPITLDRLLFEGKGRRNVMSKVFVIPDVHLKPWMFDKAEELLSRSEYEKIVCLGDLVDDWDQEKNLGLYLETFDAIERFIN